MAKAKSVTPERSAGYVSAVAGIERIAIALCLFLVPVVFATGLSRYELAKLGVLQVFGSVVLLCWLVTFAAGRSERRVGGGWVAVAGWLLVLLAACSLAWTTSVVDGWLRVSFLLLLLAVFTSSASQQGREAWIIVPLLLAAVVVAATVIAQQLGWSFPPVIPTGMAEENGPNGTFDHAFFAGAFLAVVAPVALFALSRTGRGAMTALTASAAVLSGLAVGLTGGVAVLVLGVCLFLGTLASVPVLHHHEGKRGVAVLFVGLFALGALFLGAFAFESVDSAGPEEETAHIIIEPIEKWFPTHQIQHWENVVTTGDEWSFERSRVFELSSSSPWLGTGAGGWIVDAGRGVDTEHTYYVESPDAYHLHAVPPGQFLGVFSELGLIGLLLWGIFLLGALYAFGRGFTAAEPGLAYLAVAAIGAVVLVAGTSAGFHAGESTAVMAVLGLAVSFDGRVKGVFSPKVISAPKNTVAKIERLLFVAIPAAALLVVGGWQSSKSLISDFRYQRGLVFMNADLFDDGMEALESAEASWSGHALSRYHLAIARYYLPTDNVRAAAARRAIGSAAALRPSDVRYQLMALRMGELGPSSTFEDRLRTTRARVERLHNLKLMDPANPEVYRQLAAAHRILQDFESAALAFIELTQEVSDPAARAGAFEALGHLYEEDLEDPERALRYYREAWELLPARSTARLSIHERVSAVEHWIETGTRPHEH